MTDKPKNKKVTAASIILEGVNTLKSVKQILAIVLRKLPESKADETHVKFYARKLLIDGKLKAADALTKYGVSPPKPRAAKIEDASFEAAVKAVVKPVSRVRGKAEVAPTVVKPMGKMRSKAEAAPVAEAKKSVAPSKKSAPVGVKSAIKKSPRLNKTA